MRIIFISIADKIHKTMKLKSGLHVLPFGIICFVYTQGKYHNCTCGNRWIATDWPPCVKRSAGLAIKPTLRNRLHSDDEAHK